MIITLVHDVKWTGSLDDFIDTGEWLLSKEEIDDLRLLDVGESVTLPDFVDTSFIITRID